MIILFERTLKLYGGPLDGAVEKTTDRLQDGDLRFFRFYPRWALSKRVGYIVQGDRLIYSGDQRG